MRRIVRYAFAALALGLYLCLMALVLGAVRAGRGLTTCTRLEVKLLDEGSFIGEEDVQLWLERGYGTWVGQRLDSMDIHRMERILESRSVVRHSEVWTTLDGTLHASVSQREPAVRFQKGDFGFYADAYGFIFPLQARHTILVPVIDGDIPLTVSPGYTGEAESAEERAWLAGVLEVLNYMKRSRTWDDAIVQISVNRNGDLVMVPREGRERFIFGKPDNPAGKFSRMEDYYRYVVPEKGGDCYGSVNVKYNGQIICRK